MLLGFKTTFGLDVPQSWRPAESFSLSFIRELTYQQKLFYSSFVREREISEQDTAMWCMGMWLLGMGWACGERWQLQEFSREWRRFGGVYLNGSKVCPVTKCSIHPKFLTVYDCNVRGASTLTGNTNLLTECNRIVAVVTGSVRHHCSVITSVFWFSL